MVFQLIFISVTITFGVKEYIHDVMWLGPSFPGEWPRLGMKPVSILPGSSRGIMIVSRTNVVSNWQQVQDLWGFLFLRCKCLEWHRTSSRLWSLRMVLRFRICVQQRLGIQMYQEGKEMEHLTLMLVLAEWFPVPLKSSNCKSVGCKLQCWQGPRRHNEWEKLSWR